jgi:hypothetical protein
MSTYKSHNLSWRGNDLRCAGKTIVSIALDRTYTGMWRVVLPDGRLSDMANRARAKDAAMTIALGLNSDGEETASGDPRALLCASRWRAREQVQIRKYRPQ